MDNKTNDFEQQFNQNLKLNSVPKTRDPNNPRLSLIIAIILAIIVLIESIVLFIVTSNYFEVFESEDSVEVIYEDEDEDLYDDTEGTDDTDTDTDTDNNNDTNTDADNTTNGTNNIESSTYVETKN